MFLTKNYVFHLQNLKDQILTTNVWLEHVSVIIHSGRQLFKYPKLAQPNIYFAPTNPYICVAQDGILSVLSPSAASEMCASRIQKQHPARHVFT